MKSLGVYKMSRYRGQQALLIKPIIEATKQKIRERLNGIEKIEYYLEWYKDYFSIKPQDIECKHYKNLTQALNTLCKNRISVNGEINFLIEKVRGGKGSWNFYVLPKQTIIKLIEEVSKSNTNQK